MTQAAVEAAYRQKLASNPDGESVVDTVQIYHPLISKTYYLVNDTRDLTSFLETGAPITFETAAMKTKSAANNNDMSQQASFTIVDVENILNDELDLIPIENEDPIEFTFRRYLLSDLSYPAHGPVVYEAQDITKSKGLFTASVGAPKLNNKGTGLIITPSICPLLRGILA